MPSLLRLDDVRAGYGSAAVLHAVNFTVEEGEIAVLLGANGVGKTTSLRAVAGLIRPWSGSVTFQGKPIDRVPTEKIVRLGVGMVPGPPGVFRELSVIDNLRVGSFAVGRDAKGREARVIQIFAVFPRLLERQGQRAGSLSGGEQRMLAIARALMGQPTLLLVDEPSIGLSPVMVSTVMQLLDSVRHTGVSVLMAEQNVAALAVADRAYVMEKGRIVREARDQVALNDLRTDIARSYLGGAGPVATAGARR